MYTNINSNIFSNVENIAIHEREEKNFSNSFTYGRRLIYFLITYNNTTKIETLYSVYCIICLRCCYLNWFRCLMICIEQKYKILH